MRTIQRYDHNKILESQFPITTSSRSYHLLVCLDKAPEINKVMKNIPFTRVGLPPLVLQTRRVHQNGFWCSPLTFVFLSEDECQN